MRRLHLTCWLLAASLLAAPALAQGPRGGSGGAPHGGPPGGPGGPDDPEDFLIERNADRLGLDDATIAKIREVARSAREDKFALYQQMEVERKKLHELLLQELPDESAVMAAADQLSALEGEQLKARLATTLKIRQLLSAKQRAELVKILGERRKLGESFRSEREAAVTAACGKEIRSFCSGLDPGPARGACLFEHESQLGEQCRGALPRGHGPRARGSDAPPGP